MRATILGTGPSEGVPAPLCSCEYCLANNRTRSSMHVETEDKSVLLDVSPDVRKQLFENDITTLDSLLVTHFHFDHSNGLRELYNTTTRLDKLGVEDEVENHISNYLGKEFRLYCSPFTESKLRNNIKYAMEGHGFNVESIESDTFTLGDINVQSFITEHTRGYIGFILEHNGDKIVYNPDHGTARTNEDFNNVDALVYDVGAFIDYEVHGTKTEFQEFINTVDPEEIYFTNVSEHVCQKSTENIRDMIDMENAYVVDDGTRIL